MRAGGRPVIGWDIGGAHVKAALVRNGRLEAVRQWPCALWKGLHLLDPVIDEVLADWAPSFQPASHSHRHLLGDPEHAVTMTGEMVDLFESREDGVMRLVLHLRQRLGPALRLFCGSGAWVDSEAAAARWQDLASANWAATARLAAARFAAASREHGTAEHGTAMLVDIGSTTTDFIPLAAGEVAAAGRSDPARLCSGELLYQGVVRTPLCALAQRIGFRGHCYNVMNEWFATTADVYRLTGELDPGHDQHPAADGGEKSVEGSRRRIARMIGHDAQDAPLEDWITFAREWRRLQLSLLESGLQAAQPAGLPPSAGTMPLIGAGCGSFLVRSLARATGRAYLDFDALVDMPPTLRNWAKVCAPAVAVAVLREQVSGVTA